MARNRYLCLSLIPLVALGSVSCQSPPAAGGSPAEVVGGSIHVCSTTQITQTSDPYVVAVDDNSKVKLSNIIFLHAPPTFTNTWKIILSNRDHSKREKAEAVTLTSGGTMQVKIHLRGDSIWLPATDPKQLKFHDKDCGNAGEDPRCDRLVHITFVTTAANGTKTTTKGLCMTGVDEYGDPDGICSIVIGTPPATPMPCD